MDDLRVAWIKDKVYAGLGLKDEALFKELLSREEGRAKRELVSLLDASREQLSGSIIFYPLVTEVEREVEVEEGEGREPPGGKRTSHVTNAAAPV